MFSNPNTLEKIMLNAPIGICILNADDLVVEIVNESFLQIAGKPRDTIFGKSFWEPFAEVRTFYEQSLLTVITEGIEFRAEEVEMMLIRHGKKEIIYVTFVYSPMTDDQGNVSKVCVWALENTLQVAARLKIKEAQEAANLAIKSADLGVYELDFKTGEIITDRRYRKIFDNYDSALRDDYLMMLHPEDRPIRDNAYAEAIKSGHLEYESRIVLKDNGLKHIRLTGKLLQDAQNEITKIIGVVQDITEATTAKNRIENSEQNLRNMISEAPVAMCILRGKHHVVDIANTKILGIWGKTIEEVIDKPLFQGIPEAVEQGFEYILKDVYLNGKTFSADERPVNLLTNGILTVKYINFTYQPIIDTDSKISGVLVVAVDVSEQVAARRKIEQVVEERTLDLEEANANLIKSNEELAQFAHIASHDLQEPLRKISTFLHMMEDLEADTMGEKAKDYLGKIYNSTSRMSKLIKDILAYSEVTKENIVYEDVDLNSIAENILEEYDLLIEEKRANIVIDELPTIKAISLQMFQLFWNIIGNSLKFARKDSDLEIHISTSKVDHSERHQLQLSTGFEYIKIQFTDNGIGIPPEYISRIFKIFQRLHRKADYEGTGIGLSLCRKIALNHGGEMDALGSDVGKASFNVYLPVR